MWAKCGRVKRSESSLCPSVWAGPGNICYQTFAFLSPWEFSFSLLWSCKHLPLASFVFSWRWYSRWGFCPFCQFIPFPWISHVYNQAIIWFSLVNQSQINLILRPLDRLRKKIFLPQHLFILVVTNWIVEFFFSLSCLSALWLYLCWEFVCSKEILCLKSPTVFFLL